MPRPGQVLGLVGTNGIGKSTALMILAGKLKPNLGRFDNPPDWQEILVNFRGSDLQNFFTKLLEDNIKAIIKPQYVDSIPRSIKGKVSEIVTRKDERGVKDYMYDLLDLTNVSDRDIEALSGGELQRKKQHSAHTLERGAALFVQPLSRSAAQPFLAAFRCSCARVCVCLFVRVQVSPSLLRACSKQTCTCSTSLRRIWMCASVCALPMRSATCAHRRSTSCVWSTICPCWTTCPTSCAAFTANLVRTEW